MKMILYLAITAIIACVSSQMMKVLLNYVGNKKIPSVSTVFQDGAFPSSHSAYTTSITVATWLNVITNIESDMCEIYIWLAVVTTVFSSVVIRDALGVRRTVQKLCDTVILMLEDENHKQDEFKKLKEKLKVKNGHEPHEVIGGIVWGILVALLTSCVYYHYLKYLPIVIFLMAVFIIYGILRANSNH